MSSEAVVTSLWPMAVAHRFMIGGSEVYALPDINAKESWILGSGISLEFDGRVNGEEWIDYTVTEDAAWEHAAIFARKAIDWVKAARKKGIFSSSGITVHGDRFDTSRMLFLRRYRINYVPVTRLEFTRQLGLRFKWAEDENA